MKDYIKKNLKSNIRKFILMLVLLIACSTFVLFTMEVVTNLIHEMNIGLRDNASKEDTETMIVMLYCVIGMLIGFSYLMVDNTYSIILHGREEEFNLLYRLGLDKQRIKSMLYEEVAVIGTISVVIGSILSKILSALFMDKFELYEQQALPITVYIYVELGVILALIYLINKNMKILPIGIVDNRHISGTTFSKKQIIMNTIFFLIGMVIIIVCSIDKEAALLKGFGENATTIQMLLFWGSVIIGLDGAIYWMLIALRKVANALHMNSLHIAIEQNIFNFKKIKSIMSALTIAVLLLVGFQGLYESIRETTRHYINESIAYDYMVICDTLPDVSEDALRAKIEANKGKNGRYAIALTVNLADSNDRNFTVTGMDEDYYEMQKLYVLDQGSYDDIFKEDGTLHVLFPIAKARDKDWTINDEITEYTLNDEVFSMQIAEFYDPINLKQAFTSRYALSIYMYGTEEKYNTIYFTNFSYEDVTNILVSENIKDYNIYNMGDLRSQCMEQVINGTELIEAAIYVSLLFVVSMIVNIFVLSYSDRIKQYTELRILGADKKLLIGSMMIESILIFIIGTGIGYALGVPFIKGALDMIKSQLIFDTMVYIPHGKLALILAGCFIGIVGATVAIGMYSLKGKLMKFNYKE